MPVKRIDSTSFADNDLYDLQFGMPSLIETRSLEDCISLCKELGLIFIELNMNLPQYQLQNIDVAKFYDVAKSSNIYYTIHLDENFNVCDFNKLIAHAYLDTAFQTIALAKILEMPIINMHLSNGVHFTMPDERIYLFDEYLDIYLEKLKFFRDECEKMLADSSIKICIENSDGYNRAFIRKGLDLLLESDVFKLTFDIGHNWSMGGTDESIIMQRENKLHHMHMHDAIGKKNHLVLGTGEINLGTYLKLAKRHSCRVVLETKTIEGLKQSMAYINNL